MCMWQGSREYENSKFSQFPVTHSALESSQRNVLQSSCIRQVIQVIQFHFVFLEDTPCSTFESRVGAHQACCIMVILGLHITIILDSLFLSPKSDSLFPKSHVFFFLILLPHLVYARLEIIFPQDFEAIVLLFSSFQSCFYAVP